MVRGFGIFYHTWQDSEKTSESQLKTLVVVGQDHNCIHMASDYL